MESENITSEAQSRKVELYAKRSFGEKLNATFDFVKENWKPLLKYSTYLILPICLLQGINMNGMADAMMYDAGLVSDAVSADNAYVSVLLHYFGLSLFALVGSLLLYSLLYALVRLYGTREKRLVDITFADIKPLFFHNLKRAFLMGTVCFLVVMSVLALVAFMAGDVPYTLLVTVPLMVAFAIPLALLFPVCLFEDNSLFASFKKTYRLGFATWGGIFLVIFIMSLLAGILQGVGSIPYYIVFVVKMIFTMSENEAASSVGVDFMQYLFSVLMIYISYLSSILVGLSLAYQYGHASEVVDSITVESDIDNFDKL